MSLTYTKPEDKLLNRNRKARRRVLIGTSILTPLVSSIAGVTAGRVFFDGALPMIIGGIAGAGGGVIAVTAMVSNLFLIVNNSTGMFLTIDRLRSLLDRDDINVAYGPGTHICFPWEQRLPENNIPLEEATVTFEFSVLCTDGLLQAKGSARLRPDIQNPLAYLSGVASVAEDITDLVIAFAVEKMARTTVTKATKFLPELNQLLRNEFVKYPDVATQAARAAEYGVKPKELGPDQTVFELRFGVGVGDIVIKELLPSEEVLKTISALTEATAIKKGTAIMLGLSMRQVADRLKDKSLSQTDYNNARDRFLAVSGNMEGVDITRYEVDLSAHGIDPATVEALLALLRQVPPQTIAQVAQAATGKKGGKKK